MRIDEAARLLHSRGVRDFYLAETWSGGGKRPLTKLVTATMGNQSDIFSTPTDAVNAIIKWNGEV